MAVPTNMPKLRTFRQFHPSFHTAPYLNQGPPTSEPRHSVSTVPITAWTLNWSAIPRPPSPLWCLHNLQTTISIQKCKPSNSAHNGTSQLSCHTLNTNRALQCIPVLKDTILQHIYPYYSINHYYALCDTVFNISSTLFTSIFILQLMSVHMCYDKVNK